MNQSSYAENYFVFDFERTIDYRERARWLKEKSHWMIYITLIYLALVLGLKKYMENRRSYELKKGLAYWNLFLAVLTIFGSLRSLPLMINDLHLNGITYVACDSSYYDHPVQAFWGYIITISKILEMFDTVFIVLRKRNLIFLHWYHHITVMWFAWYLFMNLYSPSLLFALFNGLAHSLMYSYYFLKTSGFKVSRYVSMSITIAQLTQFFGGLFVVFKSMEVLNNGGVCGCNYETIFWSLILYFSYMVLFINFFVKEYFGNSVKGKAKIS